jgi:hypothetical protein
LLIVIPAKAEIQANNGLFPGPAFAGMTQLFFKLTRFRDRRDEVRA